MRYLVTGGAGFIGSHLVRRLAEDPAAEVVVLDNLRRPRWRPDSRCLFLEGDIRDRETLAAAMSGINVVFHLAAQSNVMGAESDREYSFCTNVVGTFRVLEAARSAGVSRLVFASSREVYGEQDHLPVAETAPTCAKNYYGASKLAAEAYCRVFAGDGLPVTILRLANVYGPGDRDRVIPLFLTAALRGEPIVLYGGPQVVDFLWIEDAVDALIRASRPEAPAGPINLGSGTGITVRELADIIHGQISGGVRILQLPARPQEVTGYVADIGRALRHGLLTQPRPPLSHLPLVLDELRAEVIPQSSRATASRAARVGSVHFSTVGRLR